MVPAMQHQPQECSKRESSEPYADSHSSLDMDDQSADTEGLLHPAQGDRHKTKRRFHPLVIAIVSSSALLLSFLLGGMASRLWIPVNADRLCAKHTNSYSPIVNDVDIKYSAIRFNGSLLKENKYRQPAGPEVDAAWEELGVNFHAVVIPESEGAASGLADKVRINPKHGGGHPANVEGLHQLHCLNLLRKTLWYNFDYYHEMGMGPFANADHVLRFHVTHCLDIIRQQLMCQVDTGVLGQVWWNKEAPESYVDFNTEHRCKNFEAVRDWAKARQLPEEVPKDFLLPPGPNERVYEEIP